MSFLSLLEDDELRALEAGRRRPFRRGAILFAEGEPADNVLIIKRGRVKVTRATEEGRDVVLGVVEPGDLCGEVACLDGRPRSATAVALEPGEATTLPSKVFLEFLWEHRRVAFLVLSGLCDRLRQADEARTQQVEGDATVRVARRLLQLVDRFGEPGPDGIRIDLSITQQDLAGWTASSRESVNKVLANMRGNGWIRTHRRGLTVLDPEALARCASD